MLVSFTRVETVVLVPTDVTWTILSIVPCETMIPKEFTFVVERASVPVVLIRLSVVPEPLNLNNGSAAVWYVSLLELNEELNVAASLVKVEFPSVLGIALLQVVGLWLLKKVIV